MLDGSDEGEVNALAITKYNHLINFFKGKENISYQEVKTKKLNYGVMMKEYVILLEQVTQEQSLEYE